MADMQNPKKFDHDVDFSESGVPDLSKVAIVEGGRLIKDIRMMRLLFPQKSVMGPFKGMQVI